MKAKYTITISNGDSSTEYKCKTHKGIADTINEHMGFKIVSKIVVSNWLTRDKKSTKYDFISVNFNNNSST